MELKLKKIINEYLLLFMLITIIGFFVGCELFEDKTDGGDGYIEDNESYSLSSDWVDNVQGGIAYNYSLSNSELLLGNSNYTAISYSGYRQDSRGDGEVDKDSYCPTVDEIKEDMKILSAMGIRLLRTYDTQQYLHASRVMEAITELKEEDSTFEMYIMLGAWIQCEDAYTSEVDHRVEDLETNTAEINKAIELASTYPDIVKIIAVGNEAMVTWQAHYVPAAIILKWIQFLKAAKTTEVNGMLLPEKTLITSSDNFATWGDQNNYKSETLLSIINEIDFIYLHTYPFHDSHYNSAYWKIASENSCFTDEHKTVYAMNEAFKYAVMQYKLVKTYLEENNIDKPIHIGETGWATTDSNYYGDSGSRAADELKSKLYYKAMKKWSEENNVSLFYFEAFDEPWKGGAAGSESHFGLFTVDGKAKYAIWNLVDDNTFSGLTRGRNEIIKTFGGVEAYLLEDVLPPLVK